MKSGFIEGNILFVDGTKIRANASIKNNWDKERCENALEKVDRRIEAILDECERLDKAEEAEGVLHRLEGDLADQRKRKEKVQAILREIDEENRKSKNTVDPDSAKMHSVQGTHASYNVPQVVDDRAGLIVHVDAVGDANDCRQFSKQIQQANEQLSKPCQVACADAGYANTEEMAKVDREGIRVIVPSQRQALHDTGPSDPFHRDRFI